MTHTDTHTHVIKSDTQTPTCAKAQKMPQELATHKHKERNFKTNMVKCAN